MFCPECGMKNEDDARFCSACGTSLSEYQNQPEAAQVQEAEPTWIQPEEQQQPTPVQQPQPALVQPGLQPTPVQQSQPAPQPEQAPPPTQVPPPVQQSALGQPQSMPRPQQPKPPRPPRKPVPVVPLLAVIIESVLVIALVIGIFFVLNNKFSPKTVALDYWKAVAAKEWGTAYDYCEFPDSAMLTKQMYVDVNAAKGEEPIQYKSVSVEKEDDWGSQLFDLGTDSNSTDFEVKYMTKGSSYEESVYLTLSKTGEKKFLFWDEWKVTSSDSWCENTYFEIPLGAVLKLNGIEITEADITEDEYAQYITIPYLFSGPYQMEVTADGMEPYRALTYIDSYGSEYSYVELMPSRETVEAVAARAGDDLKKIIDNALAGNGFESVQDCFTEYAVSDGEVVYDYEELFEITGDGVESGIVTLTVDSMVTTLDGTPYQDTISLNMQAHIKETYLQSWTTERGEYEDTIEFYLTYEKEGDDWKLTNVPVSIYDFYY